MRRLREAREFSSCGEFLGAVRPREGKCLILDVHIPGMSGLELLENFAPQPRRARPAHRRVAAPVTPRYARFAVARAGQRGDPGFDTAWKLANVGRIPCPPREGYEPGVLDMNEMQVPQPEQVAAAPLPSRRGDPLRRWTLAILVVCVLLFGWTLIADRLTPYTSDASVRTFVVRIRPEVSGKIIEVAVHDNQIVRTGDLLYRIDPIPFRIAVERAEAKLAAAGQAVGASTAAVDEAQAQLVQEIAQRDNVREQAARVFELVRVGVYAASKGDQAQSELDTAEAQVQRAQASLEQARQALGPQGADNPQIREALAALEGARLGLSRTTLRAPGDGVVTNLQLNIGQFAAAGRPALTFLDARLVWLEAFVRENSLEYISPVRGPRWCSTSCPAVCCRRGWRASAGGSARAMWIPRPGCRRHTRAPADGSHRRSASRCSWRSRLPAGHHTGCATMPAPASSSTRASTRSLMRSPGSGSG